MSREALNELADLRRLDPLLEANVQGVIRILTYATDEMPLVGGFSIWRIEKLVDQRVLAFRLKDEQQIGKLRIFFLRIPQCNFVTGVHQRVPDLYELEHPAVRRAYNYWAVRRSLCQ